MKIVICKTPSMTEWYAQLLQRVLIELGHECKITEFGADAAGADLGIYILYGHPLADRLTKGRPKCVAFLDSEQIQTSAQFTSHFTQCQAMADVIIETAPELISVARAMTDKPVIEMPLGYHESLTLHAPGCSAPPPWDVYCIDSVTTPNRKRYYEALRYAGIKHLNASTYDLREIANCARWSKACMTVHSYGHGSALSSFRVIGMFIANRGFVVAQRTAYPYLKENEHIVYYDTPDEMIAKLIHYCENQDEARAIADAAHEHIKENMPMTMYVSRMLNDIQEAMK